jgi:hypothetical protein
MALVAISSGLDRALITTYQPLASRSVLNHPFSGILGITCSSHASLGLDQPRDWPLSR